MSDPSVRADLAQEIKRITWRIIILHQVQSFIAALPLVYLVSLVMGLSSEQGMMVLKYLLPPLNTAIGMVGPVATIYLVIKKALTPVPGESDADRLVRILKAPRRIEVLLEAQVTLGVFSFIAISCVLFNLSLWAIPWGVVVTMSLTMLVMVHVRLGIERILRPHALALFQASPTQTLSASGPLWVRQSWFLPYTFGIFVFTSLTVTVTVLGSQVGAVFTQLSSQYGQLGHEQFGEVLRHGLGLVVQGSLVPLLALGAFLLINAGVAALQLARHQTEGAAAVQSTIQGLAAGTAKLPEWVTTDEIGDLSRATARVFDRLGNLSLSLADSARLLGQSAQTMGDSNVKQTEILTRQAAAIQETQVTTQEIKQTSLVASQKAESILTQTDRADQISRSGEAAVEQSLGGLQAIRDHVKEMESRIKALDERAKQIGKITTTVKDLADQSNMLALNAAIEAVRSGEHGKGFSVVAKEIRSLADQSIKATNNVRAILQDISSAIRTTVSITEQGALKVDESLTQVRASGENIRELSVIVRENAQAVRQISVAVTQQNAGIGQIFQAINDLSTQMTETMTRVRASDEAMELVGRVAQRVSGFVDTYGWSQVKGQQTPLSSSLLTDASADARPSNNDPGY